MLQTSMYLSHFLIIVPSTSLLAKSFDIRSTEWEGSRLGRVLLGIRRQTRSHVLFGIVDGNAGNVTTVLPMGGSAYIPTP